MTTVPGSIVRRVRRTFVHTSSIEIDDVWRLMQATAAATAAWVIARRVIHHHEPFFAPIAALVSLNTSLGERGLNALRLLEGVLLGIGVAEVTLLVTGGGYGSLALATFVALLLARMLGTARVLLAQAGISAILTIAVANGEVGYQRVTDALIGAGVALVFSQLLFSPEPLRLLRRVETKALAAMAAALDLTARALEGDDALADRAIASQRELRDHLSELARMRSASARVARHSLTWRTQITPVVRENEDAGHLDLLGGSCLLLTRTSLGADEKDRRLLAPCVREFSTTLAGLARQPGDHETRQLAVQRSLDVLRGMASARAKSTAEPSAELTAALAAARMAITDLMLFVGVPADEARAAVAQKVREQQEPKVPEPVSTRPRRLRSVARWFRGRRRKPSAG